MKMVNVAIAGCGSITRQRHAPEYSQNMDCKITGFYDFVPSRSQELVDQYGGKVYQTFEELLADDLVDAVSICTANAFHVPMSIQALQAGKHVLCEKPMANTAEEAEAVLTAVKTSGKYFMIGHNQRLAPAHVQAEQLLRQGEIGKVLTFQTCFGHAGPENWGIVKGNTTWFFDKKMTFFGCLGDLGVHKIDLIRFLLKDEFQDVSAFAETLDKKNSSGEPIDVDDNVICLLRTKSNVIGTLTASWTHYGEEDNSTTLYGTEGIMKIYQSAEVPLEIIKKDQSRVQYQSGRIATNTEQVKSWVIDLFVDSIEKNQNPPISGEDGVHSILVVDAILKSVKSRNVVVIHGK